MKKSQSSRHNSTAAASAPKSSLPRKALAKGQTTAPPAALAPTSLPASSTSTEAATSMNKASMNKESVSTASMDATSVATASVAAASLAETTLSAEQLIQVHKQLSRRNCRVWSTCNQIYTRWAVAHGLSYFELMILSSIYYAHLDNLPLYQRDIMTCLGIPKQTINTIIKDYIQQGYIELKPAPADKRKKQLTFTPSGLSYAASYVEELMQCEHEAMAQMDLATLQLSFQTQEQYNQLFERTINPKSPPA